MPKTADKRAQTRRSARVQRAHQIAPEHTVVRRVPAARRRKKSRGIASAVRDYPWATTIFAVLLIGLALLFAHGQRLGPWAVTKPTPPPQAKCNLQTHTCNKAPLMTISTSKTYTATIKTAHGDIVIALDAKNAPIAVNNFVFLAQQGYYNGLDFWRVEQPGKPSPLNGQPSTLSLIQGGAPQAGGKGDAGYSIKDDPVTGDYTAGAVAMANTGQPNTGSTQFFICTGDDSKTIATKTYSIFGRVSSGLTVAQAIQPNDKMLSVTIAVK
jgi:cyclophilin family peptidyl-prolyl cis-trans isomerase